MDKHRKVTGTPKEPRSKRRLPFSDGDEEKDPNVAGSSTAILTSSERKRVLSPSHPLPKTPKSRRQYEFYAGMEKCLTPRHIDKYLEFLDDEEMIEDITPEDITPDDSDGGDPDYRPPHEELEKDLPITKLPDDDDVP